MQNTNTLISVALNQKQWEIISTVLDGTHENIELTIKESKTLELSKDEISKRKEYCNDLVEIMDDIADQISGITEDFE